MLLKHKSYPNTRLFLCLPFLFFACTVFCQWSYVNQRVPKIISIHLVWSIHSSSRRSFIHLKFVCSWQWKEIQSEGTINISTKFHANATVASVFLPQCKEWTDFVTCRVPLLTWLKKLIDFVFEFQHLISEALLMHKWDTRGPFLFEQWNEFILLCQDQHNLIALHINPIIFHQRHLGKQSGFFYHLSSLSFHIVCLCEYLTDLKFCKSLTYTETKI